MPADEVEAARELESSFPFALDRDMGDTQFVADDLAVKQGEVPPPPRHQETKEVFNVVAANLTEINNVGLLLLLMEKDD